MDSQAPAADSDVVTVPKLGSSRDFDDQVLSQVTIWSREEPNAIRHWRIGLSFARPARVGARAFDGISVDMTQAKLSSLVGMLDIQPRIQGELFSRRVKLFQCHIDFEKTVKVKDVIDLILRERRQCYMFNPAGSGCLFWQLELLELFVQQGWIKEEELQTAKNRIEGLAKAAKPKTTGTVPWPPAQGTFY